MSECAEWVGNGDPDVAVGNRLALGRPEPLVFDVPAFGSLYG